MNPEERERLVDSILDRALGPQIVEPREGLEERILAKLPAEPQRRRWWQWMWLPALAAAAILAVVIGMRVLHRDAPAPIESKKTVEQPKQEMAVRPELPTREAIAPRRAVATQTRPKLAAKPKFAVAAAQPQQALPRQAVFPAPVPLTDQERLLLALVNRQRPEAELLAAEQQAQREKVQKYFETGEVPETQPITAQPMR
jgi:hypothetical protein